MTEKQWAAHVRMMVALMNKGTFHAQVFCERDAAWKIQAALITPEGTFEMVPPELNKLIDKE